MYTLYIGKNPTYGFDFNNLAEAVHAMTLLHAANKTIYMALEHAGTGERIHTVNF